MLSVSVLVTIIIITVTVITITIIITIIIIIVSYRIVSETSLFGRLGGAVPVASDFLDTAWEIPRRGRRCSPFWVQLRLRAVAGV